MGTAPGAVIFDYYFTLAQPASTRLVELAAVLGGQVDEEEIERHRRELFASQPLAIPAFDGEPAPFRTFHEHWLGFGEAVFGRVGIEGGGAAYASRRRQAHRNAALYADVTPTLARLRQDGWRLGVLSDADRDDLAESMARNGLVFDAVVCSEELGCYKPHRSCFEAVCARLDVAAPDATYVGDSPVNDIEGSRRAGLRAVWLNRRQLEWPTEFEPPRLVAQSLDDLPELLGLDSWR